MDPALLRPGRLGNVVYVPLPSSDERLLILKALARKKPISEDVDLVALAEQCLNFNGADLASLVFFPPLSPPLSLGRLACYMMLPLFAGCTCNFERKADHFLTRPNITNLSY